MWQLIAGLFWTSLGFAASHWMPSSTPKRMGKCLYWVGVPLQVFALARKSDFHISPWVPTGIVLGVLVLGLGIAVLCIRLTRKMNQKWLSSLNLSRRRQTILLVTPQGLLRQLRAFLVKWCCQKWIHQRPTQGSFILSSMLGNTMFIGMAIAPSLIHSSYLSWIVIFGIVHYLLGSYGVGVLLAHHYGSTQKQQNWSIRLLHLLKVPTLWAFGLGWLSQPLLLGSWVDSILAVSLKTGVPSVFFLFGLQLGTMQIVRNLSSALVPATIRMLIIPCLAGLGLTLFGVSGDARLSLVLMTGMPTNSANLILAEEYQLDPQLAAGSIVISTLLLPMMIPLWMTIFG
jgi:malate permease and related proteins